ncbi:MAG: mobile mystery protein B [Gemmatimonadota bacterium]
MKLFQEEQGNTPLDEDESEGLIPPHLSTRAELNQWEANNIESAQEWATQRISEVLDVTFLGELHQRMFGMTWEWAGSYRKSDKNITPHSWTQVPTLMRDLVDNTRAQYDASSKAGTEVDEIAARFHHGLVHIHPWASGNGRHARLATELLLRQWGRPPFTWGNGSDLVSGGEPRSAYLGSLKDADRGDFASLIRFVRS